MFPYYPRDIGTYRAKATNFHDVENFILKNNGVTDCFIGLYDNTYIIDKLFFDIDSKKGFTDSKNTAKKLYNYLLEQELNPIPILTGKKGFHFYVPLVPKRYSNAKNILKRATTFIINDALDKDVSQIDFSVVGDIRQLCRVFNTLRPPQNMSWCVLLPEDWTTMTSLDLVALSKEPNYIHHDWLPTVKLTELELADEIAEEVQYFSHSSKPTVFDNTLNAVDNILKMSLKPCLYKAIKTHNPPHFVRGAATAELLKTYSVEDVVWIYSRLNWMDFNSNTTRNYVQSWIGGNVWSCQTLREKGIKCVEECEMVLTI